MQRLDGLTTPNARGWERLHLVPRPAPWLTFRVSLNEEHTFLTLHDETGLRIDLGERVHHYCLLTLARRKLDDANCGLDATSMGWTESGILSRMLGLDASHLNIQIYRARRQLRRAVPRSLVLPDLIERRRGELRIGAWGLRVVRGLQLEAELAETSDSESDN